MNSPSPLAVNTDVNNSLGSACWDLISRSDLPFAVHCVCRLGQSLLLMAFKNHLCEFYDLSIPPILFSFVLSPPTHPPHAHLTHQILLFLPSAFGHRFSS